MTVKHPLRVLFVNPPSVPYTHVVRALAHRELNVQQPISMPMGILYLAAVLEREISNVEIKILDFAKALREFEQSAQRQATDFDRFADTLLRDLALTGFVPDVVGISVLFSTAHKSTGHIASALKRLWPSAPVVVGGMHATNATGALLEMDPIDYVCRGEAESIVADVFARAASGEDISGIQGIISRAKLKEGGGKAPCESAPLINDLDEIPFPAWHLIPMSEYIDSGAGRTRNVGQIEQHKEATIVTTRGCPFSCTFCSSWTVHGRTMRFRSVANVMEELAILHDKYKVNAIVPEDDLFTVKKPRIIELCNAIAARYGNSIQFHFTNGLSVATLDEDVIRALVRMGMHIANIAIESGSAYVQRHIIKKNCNLDRARRVVQFSRDIGITTRAYFIMGFPGETREHINETIDFAGSLPTDWCVFNVAAPLSGTEMYDQMLERGWIDKEFNWDSAFFAERTFDTSDITAADLKKIVYDTNIRVNFFNNHNMRIGEYERARLLFENILSQYPSHIVAQYCVGAAKRSMGDHVGYVQALDICRALLNDNRNEMAREQFAEFGDLMPELFEESAPPPFIAKSPDRNAASQTARYYGEH